ncbi:MAG: pentapeptide repeat-containing protein [Polyangiaceae bacterium]|jgi:uncharacterized protein YjbI with pentapeptide repeats|nr:pentapeptide repeat-containing protein [Polyangiaceae bacterium]
MRVKNLTPFQAATVLTSRRPPQPEVAVIVKGSFRLAPGPAPVALEELADLHHLTGDVFAEQDLDGDGPLLYASDLAELKLNAEVHLSGRCYAPGERPAKELPVFVKVGAWSKGATATSAVRGEPFLATALPPAFRPLSPKAEERARKQGKEYGARWAAERRPFRSVDFDWSYFSAAPADQQLKGYLRGDEDVTLHSLHPRHAVLETRLPGLRVRVVLKDDKGELREATAALDTVLFETERAIMALTWRAHLPVRETDLADVRTLLVASEPLGDSPKPLSFYRQRIEAFEADPAGLREAVPKQYHAVFFKDEPPPGPVDDNPVVALLDKKLPGAFGEHRAKIKEALDKAASDPKSRQKMVEQLGQIEAAEADAPPPAPATKPGTYPELHLRRLMRGILERSAKIRESVAGKEVPAQHLEKLEKIDRLPHDPKWKQLDPEYTPPVEPISTDEPGPGRDLREQDLTGRDLSGLDLSGADLRQAILTRCNLDGANLSGANLRGAVLFKASLKKARLIGANLSRANLVRADFADADLSEATLTDAFFEGATLRRARLLRARGEYPLFMKADLSGADLSEVAFDHADFTGALLRDAAGRRAVMSKSAMADVVASGLDLTDAKISGSGLGRADLRRATLVGLRAEHCLLVDATLDDADLGFAVLTGAHLTGASAKRASFYGANLAEARLYRCDLEEARFDRSNLLSADLCKARLEKTSFRGASCYDARFLGASGKDADFVDAVLERSTLVR